MDFTLKVDDKAFQVIWSALGELPAKHSFQVMLDLANQVKSQEAAHVQGVTDVANS
jgi:hypothetical protein